jgi:hypothetical protein
MLRDDTVDAGDLDDGVFDHLRGSLRPILEVRRIERALTRALRESALAAHDAQYVAEGALASCVALRERLREVARVLPHAPLEVLDRPAEEVLLDDIAAPEPRRPAEPVAPPPSPSPRGRPWRGDARAQAEILRRAAEGGMPFCEICATPERASTWSGDAAAQAATLVRAARQGVPFCEICERAAAQEVA